MQGKGDFFSGGASVAEPVPGSRRLTRLASDVILIPMQIWPITLLLAVALASAP